VTRHDQQQFNEALYLTGPWSPSWPIRWEEARGTYSEKACLLSIAAETRGQDMDIFCAAYDAAMASDADERAELIAEMEALFDAANEHETACYGPPDNYDPDCGGGWWPSSQAVSRGMGGARG